jgi:hypothetical protein
MKRDFAICLSFANLLFARVWSKVLGAHAAYYRPHADRDAAFLMVSVLLTAVFSFLLIRSIRRSSSIAGSEAIRILFVIFVVAVILPNVGLLVVIVAVVLLISVGYDRFSLFRSIEIALLICLPFVLVTFGQATWSITHPRILHADKSAKTQTAGAAIGSPVLWIIFDELDEGVVFESRPAGLLLPEFDRFKANAWSGSNAYPPANFTELSIPALISGKLVDDTKPLNQRELLLHFVGEKGYKRRSQQESVFQDARKLGLETGVVGWYHPYCDVIGDSLDRCFQLRTDLAFYPIMRDSISASVKAELLRAIPMSYLLLYREDEAEVYRRSHIHELEEIRRAVSTSLAQFDRGLLFIHLPVPHPTGIFDRGTFGFSVEGQNTYFDNLVLADRMLTEIRTMMEKRGTWNTTTVIVSADHWWRVRLWSKGHEWTQEEKYFEGKSVHRVPFLVKFPSQQDAIVDTAPFNTIISRQLVVSILSGRITSPNQLSSEIGRLSYDYPQPIIRKY